MLLGFQPVNSTVVAQVPGASVPSRLLSETVAAATLEQLERAARAERGHTLRLTDLAPGVCLPALLARWEGLYVLEPPPAGTSAAAVPDCACVRFSRPEALREALDAFGGGVRGARARETGLSGLSVLLSGLSTPAWSAWMSCSQAVRCQRQQTSRHICACCRRISCGPFH